MSMKTPATLSPPYQLASLISPPLNSHFELKKKIARVTPEVYTVSIQLKDHMITFFWLHYNPPAIVY